MRYCKECGKAIDDDLINICPSCGAEIKSNFESKDLKKLTQSAHKRERMGYDMSQNAYCFLVIGGILLTIGIIFFYLSFKNTGSATLNNSGKTLSYTCFEFYVFLVGVLAGAGSIIYGAIRAVMAYRIRKQYLTLIDEIRAGKFNQ